MVIKRGGVDLVQTSCRCRCRGGAEVVQRCRGAAVQSEMLRCWGAEVLRCRCTAVQSEMLRC